MSQQIFLSIPFDDFVSKIEETVRKVLSEKNTDQDKLLNSAEVMQMLNISTTTLQAWRDSKKIPFTRKGNKIYYSKSLIMSSLGLNVTS